MKPHFTNTSTPIDFPQTTDSMRDAFETVCYPNFGITSGHNLRRKPNGEYVSETVEDHWQTFQEGWEEAMKHYGVES